MQCLPPAGDHETEGRVTSFDHDYDDRRRVWRRQLVAALPLVLIGCWGRGAFADPAPDAQPDASPERPTERPTEQRQAEPAPVSSGEAGLEPASPLTASLPAPGEQRFQVYYGDMSRDVKVAEIGYRLDHEGDTYRITTRGKAVGMLAMFYSGVLIQKSVGRVSAQGLLPEQYSERRGDRAERVVSFDQARQTMLGLAQPSEVPMPPGTQDRLSVFYQLGLMARSRPALFRPGSRFTLPLASLKRIDTPTFSVVGPANVRTGRGSVPSLHLKVRNQADAEDPVIDVWLGSSLAMLPARIRIEEADGKVIDQVLAPVG